MALEAFVLSELLVLDEVSVLVEASALEAPAPEIASNGGGGGGGGASCRGSMPLSFNASSTAFLMTVIKSLELVVLELEPVESVVSDVAELSDVAALFDVRKA